MKMIICLDDRSGMMFNKRRQSKDQAVIEDIKKLAEGCRLRMNAYSAKMFEAYGSSDQIAEEDFAEKAESGDFCFMENIAPEPYLERAEKLVIYRWNRSYPGDLHFNEESLKNWKLMETIDLAGKSHEKITREIWEKA